MRLQVISSCSAGNCYLFTDNEGNTLIVECGVRFDKIKKALDFDFSKVLGCLITHEHKDHCKGARDMAAAGINIYATKGTIGALGFKSHWLNDITCGVTTYLEPYRILPFEVKHDCAEPCGFLIQHAEMGKTLFLTDTYYCEYTFPGLNNILIEANHSQKILNERLAAGVAPEFLRNRIIQSHMSLETTLKTLSAYDLKAVNNIVLIHLSDSNSNAREFQAEVYRATSKTVTVAAAGLIIENFNKTPF